MSFGPHLIVGRDPELARLQQLVEELRRGIGRTVMISGEAGTGKTTLINHAGQAAADAGIRWFHVRCSRVSPPYWIWTRIARDMLGTAGENTDKLTKVLSPFARINPWLSDPESGPRNAGNPTNADFDQFRAAEAVAGALEIFAASHLCMVGVDDAHEIDDDSLRILNHVLESGAGDRILFLICATTSEARPAPGTIGSSVRRTARFEQIHLGSFSEPESIEAVVSLSAGTLDEPTARKLHERTGGNPFFLAEAARWASEGIAGLESVPPNVMDAIQLRTSAFPAPALRALRLIAITDGAVQLGQLVERWGWEVVDVCVDSGLVHIGDRSPAVRPIMHSIVRDALRSGVSSEELARCHAIAVESLGRQTRSDRRDWIQPIAHHALRAVPFVDVEVAAGLARDAAKLALESYAFARAEQVCDAALGYEMSNRLRLELRSLRYLATVGRSHAYQTELPREQFGLFKELLDNGMEKEAVLIAVLRIGVATGEADQLGLYEQASMLTAASPRDRALMAAHRISILGTGQGRVHEAEDLYRSVREEFAGRDHLIEAENAISQVYMQDLRLREAIEHAERALVALRTMDLPKPRAEAERHLAWAHSQLSEGQKATFRGEAALVAARRSKSPSTLAAISLHTSYPMGCYGTIRQSLGVLNDADSSVAGDPRVRALRPALLTLLGEDAAAVTDLKWLAEARREDGGTNWAGLAGTDSLFAGSVIISEYLGLSTGLLDEAIEAELSAAQNLSRMTRIWQLIAGFGLGLAAIVKRDKLLGAQASTIIRELFGSTGVRQLHLFSIPGVLALLQTIDGDPVEPIAVLREVCSEFRRSEQWPRLAIALRDLSALELRAGLVDPATLDNLAEAHEIAIDQGMRQIAAQLGAIRRRAGAIVRMPANEYGLTTREIEILRLVATGMSNPDIAATLVISRHTVVRHLSNMFAKTGCSSRAELAAFAERSGLL